MKFLDNLQHLIKKPQKDVQEVYLALVIEQSFLQGVSFELHGKDTPRIHAIATEVSDTPSWEDRLVMTDKILSKLEEGHEPSSMTKVIFGLGSSFLTKDGDIEKAIRPHLKDITVKLGLHPLGFVPITSGIAHYLKRTEGIPPSVIMIHVSKESFAIAIYRVGRLAAEILVKRTHEIGENIENALKNEQDEEVMPSKILLVGADTQDIDDIKATLLRHQWTSRANFLHYPKVDMFPADDIARAIADAGAAELTKTLDIEKPGEKTADVGTEEKSEEIIKDENMAKEQEEIKSQPLDVEKALGERMKIKEQDPEKKDTEEKFTDNTKGMEEQELIEVEPESFGFHKEREETVTEPPKGPIKIDEKDEEQKKSMSFLSVVGVRGVLIAKKIIRTIISGKIIVTATVALIFIGLISWFVLNTIPKATVTLSVIPKEISTKETIIIDPTSDLVESGQKIVPGKKIEKTVAGEKTISSTGKKKVGDPAKGTVIIYNKSEASPITFKKGTVLSLDLLQFTIDTDVTIASATATWDTKTYGTGKVTVTAAAVGTEGNIAAGKELTIKEYAKDIAVARNEQAFTGGSSKEVVVVSRADYDNIQKTLTAELVEKAKSEIAQSVTGKERLVDSTIKTTVKEKALIEEIDQESKELHGTMTLLVTAISFSEDDVKSLLTGTSEKDVPTGYKVNNDRTTVTIGSVQTAKDGKMTTTATLQTIAMPDIDATALSTLIAGKKLTDVEIELKKITGIASVEFSFARSLWKDRMPAKSSNISIVVVIQ